MNYLRNILILVSVIAGPFCFASEVTKETKQRAELGTYDQFVAYITRNAVGELEECLKRNRNILKLKNSESASLLHAAIQYNKPDVVALFVQYGADVNEWDRNHQPPLFVAVKNGYERIVDILLACKNINVHARDAFDDSTALHLATVLKYDSIARKLVSAGADSNAQNIFKETPRTYAYKYMSEEEAIAQLCEAIKNDDIKEAQQIISLTKMDVSEKKVMSHAIQNGNLAIVQLLCKHGADFSFDDGYDELSLLAEAVQCGHYDIVKFLLEQGVSVNGYKDKNDEACSPIWKAVAKNDTPMVRLLLAYDPSGEFGGDPTCVVGEAAMHGKTDMVDLLQKHGHQLCCQAKCGFIKAIKERHIDVVRLLLATEKDANSLEDVCQDGDEGCYTPLGMAATVGDCALINLLLEKGALLEGSLDDDDRTPLMLAALHGHKVAFDLLISKGASTDACDKNNNNLLFHAFLGGHKEIIKYCQKLCAPLSQKQNNLILLNSAEYGDNVDVLRYILQETAEDQRAQITCVDPEGMNALHKAILFERLNIVQYLTKNYPQLIDMVSNTAESVCHLILRNESITILEYFLKECFFKHIINLSRVININEFFDAIVHKENWVKQKHFYSVLSDLLKNPYLLSTEITDDMNPEYVQFLLDQGVKFHGTISNVDFLVNLLKNGIDVSQFTLSPITLLPTNWISSFSLYGIIAEHNWIDPENIKRLNQDRDFRVRSNQEMVRNFFNAIKANKLRSITPYLHEVDPDALARLYDRESIRKTTSSKKKPLISMNTALHVAVDNYNNRKKEKNEEALKEAKKIINLIHNANSKLWNMENEVGETPFELLLQYGIEKDFEEVGTGRGVLDKPATVAAAQYFDEVAKTLHEYEIPSDIAKFVVWPYLKDSDYKVTSKKLSSSSSSASADGEKKEAIESAQNQSEQRHKKRKATEISSSVQSDNVSEDKSDESPLKKHKKE